MYYSCGISQSAIMDIGEEECICIVGIAVKN